MVHKGLETVVQEVSAVMKSKGDIGSTVKLQETQKIKKSSPQAAFSVNRFLSVMAVDSMAPSLLYRTPGTVN